MSQLEGTHRVRTYAELMYPNSNPNLDLWPFNPKTKSLPGYPKVIPYTKFEHFGIISFWVVLRTNKQTNRWHRTPYPRRPTYSAWAINTYLYRHGSYLQCTAACTIQLYDTKLFSYFFRFFQFSSLVGWTNLAVSFWAHVKYFLERLIDWKWR